MKKLIAKIRAILRNRRVRKIWTRTVSSTACLVVFVTTYALILPAITMESKASCGIEAHQHDESCYEERLICNIPESDGHKHTADCYSTTQKLICNRSEHLHTSDCYDEEGNLTCSQEEHQHGKECYEEIRELICGLEESEGHHHDSSCYEKVLTCEKEVHTHSTACYREDAASVAATEHAAVAATTTTSADDDAIGEAANASGTFDPAETAAEGYVPPLDELDFRQLLNDHTAIYYHKPADSTEDSGQITDWKRVDEDTVLGESDILRVYLAYTIPAGSLNETNATARYRLPGNLHLTDKQMETINQMENGLSGLYLDYDTLQITDTEKHSAYLGAEAVDGFRTPDQTIEDYLSDNNDAGDGEQTAQEIISAVVKADQVYDEDGVYGKKDAYLGTDLVFTFSPYTILKNRNEYDSEGTPVKAGESVSGWFTLDFNMDQVDWDDNAAEITFVSEDNELNTGLVSVTLEKADPTSEETPEEPDPASEESPDTNNSDDEKTFDDNSSTEENKAEAVEETHPAVSFEDSLTVHTGNLSSDTDAGNLPNSSKMTVSVFAEAGTFPDGTTMVLSAVTDMDAVAEAVEGTVDSKTCGFQAVDISFRDKDGNEIEPLKPISVTMRSDSIKAATEDSSMAPVVVHVENQSKKPADAAGELVTTVMETLPSSVDTNDNSESDGITDSSETISFKADSFSIYAIVYTVDFEYEMDGKMYQFCLPGGGFASFTDLVEVLGIIGDTKSDEHGDENGPEIDENSDGYVSHEVVEENGGNSDTNMALTLGDVEISEITRKFVADVASVEFSSPELVDVSKVEAAITVGQIKENRELQCVYSVKLTEEQIAKINAQTVDAGDWALISVQPFTSEETLTVTMRNGDCFTITVTDAQDAVMNPDGTTVQTISNPAGTTIDLFDYWVDTDLRNNDSRTAWPGYSDSWNPNAENLGGTGNEAGINAGHALKFSPAWEHTVINGTNGTHNTNGANGLNSYTGGINPFPGIVQSTLDNGYPKLTTNSTIGSDGESLAYLFDPNVSNNYRASYTGVNQLMYVDKDGYYTFNSQDYYARYNEGNKTFTVTEQTTNDSKLRGFWPFNDQSTATRNFWMGMHVNTQFSMPTGGQVLNPSGVLKPMQFEFSGDDDVWIYVDGILIGDAGGIHNRTEVDINFQTGKVSITGQHDKYLDDLFRTGLRDRGKTETEIEEYIADKFDGHTFKAGSYHTFDFFYLERGGEESNLYIHYNLVSTADFTAHKSYYGTDGTDNLRRDQFQFELIGLEEDAIMPSGGSAEGMGTVVSPKLETDEYGHKIFTTGVTEDGNVNFGSAVISEEQKRDKPTYHYIVREVVPDEAVNANGTTWAEATDEEKNAGGFVLNQVEYDQTIYYMAATVTSWEETDSSGRPFIRYGLDKKYYTDDTYTTPKQDINFISFLNRYKPVYGNVDFTKVNGTGDPLQGAVFTLYKDEVCTIPAADLDTEGHPVWTARSDLNGKVSFENVRVGTYYMKETTAPENYALSEIIYKVVVEDEKDTSKTSRITILGDESGTIVDSIANAKSGEITVLKKWLNVAGTEVDGGSNTAKVKLKRYKQVVESSNVETHTVTINLAIRDYSGNSWTETAEKSFRGDHVTVEWTVVDGANDNVFTGQDSSYWDESSRITVFSKSFSDVSSDITLNVILNEYWPMQNGKFNIDSFSIAQEEPDEPIVNIVADDDFDPDSITLNSSSSWSQTWNIGGTESSHNGFDFPAMDDNGRNYLYYVVELDTQGNAIEVGGSPLEGYVLQGYSANNNTGVSNQGVITIYNRAEGLDAINVVIKKTDNVENSTNYLDGAVFKMMYRSDSSGTFTNVSNESVPELDSDSQFTVPTAGIILTGLVDGQYLLQEISPPSGYVITNSTPVTFTVSGGTITSTEGTITGVRYTAATETSNAEFIVPNPPGAALPNTGGPGTRLFTILGSILILGAGVLLWRRERAY